uniref:Uncharacterized protein n=1 Tax=Lotharella globosa TaxID=91324 RepID=A0A6V3LAL6_9EUKA
MAADAMRNHDRNLFKVAPMTNNVKPPPTPPPSTASTMVGGVTSAALNDGGDDYKDEDQEEEDDESIEENDLDLNNRTSCHSDVTSTVHERSKSAGNLSKRSSLPDDYSFSRNNLAGSMTTTVVEETADAAVINPPRMTRAASDSMAAVVNSDHKHDDGDNKNIVQGNPIAVDRKHVQHRDRRASKSATHIGRKVLHSHNAEQQDQKQPKGDCALPHTEYEEDEDLCFDPEFLKLRKAVLADMEKEENYFDDQNWQLEGIIYRFDVAIRSFEDLKQYARNKLHLIRLTRQAYDIVEHPKGAIDLEWPVLFGREEVGTLQLALLSHMSTNHKLANQMIGLENVVENDILTKIDSEIKTYQILKQEFRDGCDMKMRTYRLHKQKIKRSFRRYCELKKETNRTSGSGGGSANYFNKQLRQQQQEEETEKKPQQSPTSPRADKQQLSDQAKSNARDRDAMVAYMVYQQDLKVMTGIHQDYAQFLIQTLTKYTKKDNYRTKRIRYLTMQLANAQVKSFKTQRGVCWWWGWWWRSWKRKRRRKRGTTNKQHTHSYVHGRVRAREKGTRSAGVFVCS